MGPGIKERTVGFAEFGFWTIYGTFGRKTVVNLTVKLNFWQIFPMNMVTFLWILDAVPVVSVLFPS